MGSTSHRQAEADGEGGPARTCDMFSDQLRLGRPVSLESPLAAKRRLSRRSLLSRRSAAEADGEGGPAGACDVFRASFDSAEQAITKSSKLSLIERRVR